MAAKKTINHPQAPDEQSVDADRAQNELHLFKFMADKVSDFVGMCDLQFTPFYINRSGLQKVGLDSPGNTENIGVKDFFFPEDQHFIINEFFPDVHNQGGREVEIRFRHFKTGEPIWMLYYVTLLKNRKGDTIGYGTISKDITKQKKFEDTVTESEERFRQLADQAPMFIWMVDDQAKIAYANAELLRFLDIPHYTEVAVQGGWERVTHPEDVPAVYGAFMNGLASHQPYSVEARLFNSKSNKYEWFLFKASPRFINKSFAGFIGTAVNINEQKILLAIQENLVDDRTRELKNANALLEQSNRELENFAYIASHDLQEPLRKIQTFAHLIGNKHRESLDSKVQNYLGKIIASATHMAELIRGLLDFSRLANDREKYFVNTDLNEIVSNVLIDFEEQIGSHRAVFEVGPLPSVEAVPIQMNQLFHNIISNAIKFSRPGVPPSC